MTTETSEATTLPADRRQHKRAEFFVSAHLKIDGRQVEVQLHDFSLKGARLEYEGKDWAPEAGQACHLTIDLGRAARIVMDATVSRVEGPFIGVHAEQSAVLESRI